MSIYGPMLYVYVLRYSRMCCSSKHQQHHIGEYTNIKYFRNCKQKRCIKTMKKSKRRRRNSRKKTKKKSSLNNREREKNVNLVYFACFRFLVLNKMFFFSSIRSSNRFVLSSSVYNRICIFLFSFSSWKVLYVLKPAVVFVYGILYIYVSICLVMYYTPFHGICGLLFI